MTLRGIKMSLANKRRILNITLRRTFLHSALFTEDYMSMTVLDSSGEEKLKTCTYRKLGSTEAR